MKTSDLLPFQQPPPVEKVACRSCKTFAAECEAPVGEGSIPMCWICAHHVVEHGKPVEHAYVGECECLPSEIYPYFGEQQSNLKTGDKAVAS